MPKTIELTDHAYARLKMARNTDESWSDVIERCVEPRRSADEIIRAIKRAAPSLEALDHAEKSIKQRRQRTRQGKS